MNKSIVSLALALVSGGALMAATDPTTIPDYINGSCALKVATAPVVDGEIDAVWSEVEPSVIGVDLRQESNNTLIAPENAADLSGQFRALWDDENLYVLIEAKDQALVLADLNVVELYISLAYTRQFGKWAQPGYCVDICRDYQIQFQLKDNTFVFGLYSYKPDSHTMQGQAVATADGYIAEFALPWADLDESGFDRVLDDGRDYIGFEIHLQDDDDGGTRDTKLAWAAGPEGGQFDNAWADTSVWGTLVLAEDSCGGGTVVEPDCSASVFNNPPAYNLGDCWKWNPVLGFIYDGFYPFVYLNDSTQWIYVFEPANMTTGFYVYKLNNAKFGYTAAAWIDGDGVDDIGIAEL